MRFRSRFGLNALIVALLLISQTTQLFAAGDNFSVTAMVEVEPASAGDFAFYTTAFDAPSHEEGEDEGKNDEDSSGNEDKAEDNENDDSGNEGDDNDNSDSDNDSNDEGSGDEDDDSGNDDREDPTEEPEPSPEVTPPPAPTEEPKDDKPDSPSLGITSVVCVPGKGVVFVISNRGAAMDDEREYRIDGAHRGEFRLGAGDQVEIVGGYGDPKLTSHEMDAQLGRICNPPGEITGVVWNNSDGDAVRDAAETGLAGVTITLWRSDDGSIASRSTSTVADGSFRFDNLADGYYTLRVDTATLPRRMFASYDPDGNFDSETSYTISSGQRAHAEFGYTHEPPGTITGVVWDDQNSNGLLDANEPGIVGIQLGLAGMVQTTDASGHYTFANLIAGTYTLTILNIPDDAQPTADPDGVLDGSTTVAVRSGVTSEQSFGYRLPQPGAISGMAWADANTNGIIDDDETGITNITIHLSNGAGTIIETTTTDSTGAYQFADLRVGLYVVTAARLGDWQPITNPNSLDDATTALMVHDGGDHIVNFGYLLPPMGAVNGTVWVDHPDGDDKAGLPGVTITVLDTEAATVAQTVTDGAGNYSVADLRPGDYTINLTDLPDGLVATVDPDGDLDNRTAISLTSDAAQADFGYQVTGSSSISGMVWLEIENFGTRDSSESGVAGTIIRLLDNNNVEITALVLEATGQFEFIDLEPGQYTLQVDASALPAELFATYDRDGELDFMTSITLRPGETLQNVEFGIVGTF